MPSVEGHVQHRPPSWFWVRGFGGIWVVRDFVGGFIGGIVRGAVGRFIGGFVLLTDVGLPCSRVGT